MSNLTRRGGGPISPAQQAINNMPMLGAFQNIPIAVPANYPISPDLEIRTDGNTVAPAPSLIDRIRAFLNSYEFRRPLDPNFYTPGQDASSVHLNAQQAANIRLRVNQRFLGQ